MKYIKHFESLQNSDNFHETAQNMIKIYVDTEEAKQDLLEQSKYIHDFLEVVKFKTKDGKIKERWIGLDSDKAGGLMHIYMCPEIIIVGKP